jgi:plasmid stabilization system protein ParE
MQNDFNFVVSAAAKDDILNACFYIQEKLYNPKAAKDLNEKFLKAFERAAKFPYGGKEYKKDYRKIIVNKYIAFYKIDLENKSIVFYRVLYGQTDYKNIL